MKKEKKQAVCQKRILVCPDSFKGTMGSITVSSIIRDALLSIDPTLYIDEIPLADGGEGSLDAIYPSLGGRLRCAYVTGPNFQKVMAPYILANDVAYIETASAAGFTLAKKGSSPMTTTSYGVGEVIADAIFNGAKRIVLFLGGVSTNDGGVGIAKALGAKFLSKENDFLPTGGTLKDIEAIDLSEMSKRIQGIEFVALTDVDNPLLGENGAAFVFAPQKGASQEEVSLLDEGLIHLSDLIKKDLEIDVASLPGGGAAGGIGAGCFAFFNAAIKKGIKEIFKILDFENRLSQCDLIITGEGRLDGQTRQGKVVSGVLELSLKHGKKVIAITGSNKLSKTEWEELGLSDVIVTSKEGEDIEKIKKTCKTRLKLAVLQHFKQIMKDL